jgi:hypothetical protein
MRHLSKDLGSLAIGWNHRGLEKHKIVSFIFKIGVILSHWQLNREDNQAS